MKAENEVTREQYERMLLKGKRKSKYHAQKESVDGVTFDSKKEAEWYVRFSMMEKSGLISNLRRQVPYELIPVQREAPHTTKTGKLMQGKVLERACTYIADFVYHDEETGKEVVVDCKGFRTKEYRIKRKLMLYRYGIAITEL